MATVHHDSGPRRRPAAESNGSATDREPNAPAAVEVSESGGVKISGTALRSPIVLGLIGVLAGGVGVGGLSRAVPQEVHVASPSQDSLKRLEYLAERNAEQIAATSAQIAKLTATVEAQAQRMDALQSQVDRLLDAATAPRRR